MRLLWLTNKLPLSKLITWGLDEPVSHFAIVFDDKIVFHSDLSGLHVEWFSAFMKNRTIVFEKQIDITLEQEEYIYQNVISKYHGSSYDFGAFAYFIWRGILKKFFKKPMPNSNPWASKKRFICDEVIQLLPEELVGAEIKKADLAIRSPYQVWLMINK